MKNEKQFIEEFWKRAECSNSDKFFKKKIYKNSSYVIMFKTCAMFFIGLFMTTAVFATVYTGVVNMTTGKSVIDGWEINFSNEKYDEYKNEAIDQVIEHKNTTVNLVSGVYDEGFTILEFDIKLSKKDKEHLMLGEKTITDEQLKETEKMGHIARINSKDSINTVGIIVNSEPHSEWNRNEEEIKMYRDKIHNTIIDGKAYNLTKDQVTKKVSDYEYKVYLFYLITDDILKGKDSFTMTFKDIVLKNRMELKEIPDNGLIGMPIENLRFIPMDGDLEITLSTDKISNEIRVVKPDKSISKYENITKKVDEVVVTPLQIVAKITTTMDGVSYNSLQSSQDSRYVEFQDYTVYDLKEDKVNSITIDIEKKVIYSDGTEEIIPRQEIVPKKNFYNGKMQITQYVIIENTDELENILIEPVIEKYNKVEDHYEDFYLDKVNIDLSK